MKTNHIASLRRAISHVAGILAIAAGLITSPPVMGQTQTFPCETVMQFGTGMSAGGAKLRSGSVDPFFAGVSANFPTRGDAFVLTDEPAAWLGNSTSADSQWIGPSSSVADDAAGTYVYRLQFTTPCAGARVTGRYAAGDRGALRLNGSTTVSFPTPAAGYNVWTSFSFNNLPAGANTIEFYVTNAPSALGPPGPTGLRAELNVTATCCPCIELNCPSDIFLNTCTTGATANFSITGTNRCYTNLTINCSLNVAGANIPVTPNTVFPPGTNNVICNAGDTVGHRTNCTFRVIVTRDSRPPEIDCPRPIVYLCRGGGTNVFYEVTATDDVDANPVVTCDPPSGSFFPSGTNSVSCEARDACGRVSKCSFPVIIAPDGFVKTLQAGIADSFSPGAFEPASPGSCLAASGFWNGMPFDTSWPGRQMSHSFQGLPQDIVGAKLILVMRPTQPASQDDVLRVGLQNCGAAGVWAFVQDVASLPAAGGTWNANGPTIVTLDLDALPGGQSLLAEINATQRLEFAVGTETMVDYARLEVTYCGPQTTLSGVPYSLNNAYPVHRGEGVEWRTVNSNGPPPQVEIDIDGADGLRFDIAKLEPGILSLCQFGSPVSQHHGLVTDWPTGEGTIAVLGINSAATAGQTRLSLSQPSNVIGKAVEVWNAGQLVSRYFLPGTADTAVNVPSSSCLVQMGFTTAYFFASFENPVPVNIVSGGQHVSGQVGPVVNGTSVRLYYVISVNAHDPRRVRATLPPGGFGIAKVSLLRGENWIEPHGPQQVSISDVVVSRALVDRLLHPYGDCSPAYGPWTLDLNGMADFCPNFPECHDGYVDINIVEEINFGGLRLAASDVGTCTIQNTVANSVANSIVVNRVSGGPLTINGATSLGSDAWPSSISGNSGPQSFTAHFPPNTMVVVNGQSYFATSATFNAQPQFLGQFYQVCIETTLLPQMSFKSYHSVGGPPIGRECLTLTCPTNVIANCTNEAGTVVTFNTPAATRCGGDVVVICEPPSGSVFSPGTSVVRCTAIDNQGNQDECRFLVTLRDVISPTLVIPARVIAPCTSPRGAVVDFASSAVDNCDPSPVVDCEPPSGSVFPVGTNRVTCVGIDAGGNRAVGTFQVMVSGGCGTNSCLEISIPSDIEVPCTTAGGAIVNFNASARNACTGGVIALTCVPPSGSLFAPGVTHVVCSTPSGPGQGSSGFSVEVSDVVAPEIDYPSNIVVAAQSPLGAIVSYSVTASDDCTPRPIIRCSPASGSVFPVGDTRVFCETSDGHGNSATCDFIVTVRPPRPFTASRLAGNRQELRWVGDGEVESTDALNDDPVWRRVNGTPTSSGVDRSLILPIDPTHRFFRLLPLPLLPPSDRDGDGVPDERDRCPDTPPGLRVDQFGCAYFDLVATPDLALGPEQAQLGQLRADIVRWPSVAHLLNLLPNPYVNTCAVPVLIIERDLPHALLEQSNVVRSLDDALMELLRVKGRRLLEIERLTPSFDADHADVRAEDHEIADLEQLEQDLTDSLNQHQRIFLNLSELVRSIGNVTPRQRVEVQSIDAARGFAVLSDGRRLLLPNPGSPGAPAPDSIRDALDTGVEIDADISQLPDGSLYGNTASSSAGVSGQLVQTINPRRMSLRVTPVDFGLPDFDLAPRHHLKAYRWGFIPSSQQHHLEFGQALAAVRAIDPAPGGAFKHWLKIDYDANNDGIYGTLVQKLDENTKPFVLKSGVLPENTGFNIRAQEYRAPVQVGGRLGQAELLGEEIFQIKLKPAGGYATANYSQNVFDLEDLPGETRHGVSRVNAIGRNYPLSLKPIDEMTFIGYSYRAFPNGTSTYPGVQQISLNVPFAVHFQDPNDDWFFANPDDRRKGIAQPTLRGSNNGRSFSYRVKLPRIVRDRLHDCPGQPDTFYRIPFSGIYTISQGNNGTFTHNGWQTFAWDFPMPGGTTVRAARGGRVVDLRESSSQSCWNSNAQACQNCSGSASANFVKVLHQDGTEAWYGHFQNNGVFVSINQRVYRGTPLGRVGTTGCSTGNHLHLHVRNEALTTTIPLRFESYIFDPFNIFDPFSQFVPCYLPPSNSAGKSTQ